MEKTVDWQTATEETINHLVRLIQTNTVNPPGNELTAILVIKDILEQSGFPRESIHILESAPNRANLVARIKGDGSKRPLLLSGHVDVVPVERNKWTHDPFSGEITDNAVWGRGALDMKGFLAMYLQIFLNLHRHNTPLKRDVILIAVADEENGFKHGSQYLVEQHRELIEAEYGLTEGGAMTVYFGKIKLYPIQVAEKGVCILRARARGNPGHGSISPLENPVYTLAQALEKLHQARHLPVHLTPIFLEMVEAIASQYRSPLITLTKTLRSPVLVSQLLDRLNGNLRNLMNALVTNSVSPTRLRAGNKLNVIPSNAEAALDCRLLPGQTPESVVKEIRQIIGESIDLETVFTTSGTQFSPDTELFKLLQHRTQQMDPEGLVVPFLLPGATDACQYQKIGMTVYGFTPGVLPPEMSILQMVHGHDERVPVSFIESGLPVLWDVVNEFCGKG